MEKNNDFGKYGVGMLTKPSNENDGALSAVATDVAETNKDVLSSFNTSPTENSISEILDNSIELEDDLDVTPNAEYFETLRHSGHNTYSAPMDIIDNPFDDDVNAQNVWVYIKQLKTKENYEYIKICDDGSGMTLATISQAFKLGSLTGRDKSRNLGGYGTGLKTAALTMGRRFEVRTKSENSPFYIIEFDIDDLKEKALLTNKLKVPKRIGTQAEYVEFMKQTHSKTGTIVTLTRLYDNININKSVYKDTLKNKLGEAFKYFIDEFHKHIFVEDEEVKSIDPIGKKYPEIEVITQNETFEFNGYDFKFSVYNIHHVSDLRSKEIGRNKPNAGMYIFRNNRMVGRALDLGILGLAADGYGNGIRVELFMSGDCDELFGSTFIKLIQEKSKNDIHQSFRDTCDRIIGTYTKNIIDNDRKTAHERSKQKKVTAEIKLQQDAIFKTINTNKFVDVDRKGKNIKHEFPTEKSEPTGIKRTFKGRKRNDEFTAWEMVSLGDTGPIFLPRKKNKVYIIQMNQDHALWTNFLYDAPMDVKSIFNMYFVSQAIGLEKTTYYDDEDKCLLMNEYNIHVSEQMRKLMTL